MRLSLPLRILLAAALLTAALVGLVVRESLARARGAEVVLPINAYDPRSPLSGHFVRFAITYPIPKGAACPPGAAAAVPDWRWVILRREGAFHRVASVAGSRQGGRPGDVPVWGWVTCHPAGDGDPRAQGSLSLDLRVDRFHADQRQAEAIERSLRLAPGQSPSAFAVLSIDDRGKARLKGIIVNGRRTDLTWL